MKTLVNPVFLHGWGFSSKVFEGFGGIKIDLPFHGSSKFDYEGIESLVDDIALTLGNKHDVVGWSMGGSLALLLACRYPTKVSRVFVIGATPCFGKAWSRKNIRAFLAMIKREGMKGLERFRLSAYSEPFDDEIKLEGALGFLEDYINLDLTYLLPYLDKEVFIIHGGDDPVTPLSEAFKLYNLLRDAKLFILPGGHLPVRDEKDFIRKVLKGGGHLR